MTMTRTEWLASLEQERFNVAHRVQTLPKPEVVIKEVPARCTKPHAKPCTKSHATEARDQMMFNAGRYIAGASDQVAIDAHEKLMAELDK